MIYLNLRLKKGLQFIGLTLLLSLYPAYQQELSQLDLIKESGSLTIISHSGPSTIYQDGNGLAGFEYELAQKFATELKVKLNIVEADNYPDLLRAVDDQAIHFAAANIAATNLRKKSIKFTAPYQQIEQHVVYRYGSTRPKEAKDLINKRVIVTANSTHTDILAAQKLVYPDLSWVETQKIDVDYLLRKVSSGEVDYAIINSNEYVLHRSLYPTLNIAFNIGPAHNLSWAFAKEEDDSLFLAAEDFIARANQGETLAELKNRHYGHINEFNYVDSKVFLEHIENRLPQYLASFKSAAEDHEMDWRLLAAVGYQESLWNPNAVSPTGVRGLMMLTRITAKETGVGNRLDPFQSIRGGAKYLHKIMNRLPDRLDQDNRTWLSLAAYNAGFGHIYDARQITEQQGDNPDDWFEVKKRLPLLTQPKWYGQTKYGYARGGRQSLAYVKNIRRYYNLLVWSTAQEQPERLDPYASIAMKTPLINSI